MPENLRDLAKRSHLQGRLKREKEITTIGILQEDDLEGPNFSMVEISDPSEYSTYEIHENHVFWIFFTY